MNEKTLGDRALDFLEKLANESSWYHTAIELDYHVDGEALKTEVEAILMAAGRLDTSDSDSRDR